MKRDEHVQKNRRAYPTDKVTTEKTESENVVAESASAQNGHSGRESGTVENTAEETLPWLSLKSASRKCCSRGGRCEDEVSSAKTII